MSLTPKLVRIAIGPRQNGFAYSTRW